MQSTPNTALVTEYINTQNTWRSTTQAALRNADLMPRVRQLDAQMWELSRKFTAAHWKELHARRSQA